MDTSISILSCSILLSATLGQSASATVPTAIAIQGHVTGSDSHSIQIDGISYPIEPGSQAAQDLANVRRGDAVSLEISPARTPGTSTGSKPSSQAQEVVNPATARTQSTVKVVHAPGVR
jgi:hypothetical protein